MARMQLRGFGFLGVMAACAGLLLSLGAWAGVATSPQQVMTQSGPVQGFVSGGTLAWLGLPFAAPPVQERRWTAPADPAAWTEVRSATQFAAECTQRDSSGVSVGSEDCLYLNIWRPLDAARKQAALPVMVWIHGGSNTGGAASLPGYDGARLAAQQNVVVVSLQYRLGALGWFRSDALATGDARDDSGNYGLLDQIKALQWVQQNIAAFGGDAGNVTVFGESAGGLDIWALLSSDLASGLFHRAIIQSGCWSTRTIAAAQATADATAEALVVADGLATVDTAAAYLQQQGSEWLRDYLRSKAAGDVNAAAQVVSSNFSPITDGNVLATDSYRQLLQGHYNHVPLLVGSNRDEMKFFLLNLVHMTRSEFTAAMQAGFGSAAPVIEALYPREAYSPASYYNQFTDISDHLLDLVCGQYVPAIVSDEQPTYLYHFEYDDLKPPLANALGAAHAFELPFVFGNFNSWYYGTATQADRHMLSQHMQSYWACFARTGAPSGCGDDLPEWPRFQLQGEGRYQRMVFDVPSRVDVIPAQDIERINYWVRYYGIPGPQLER